MRFTKAYFSWEIYFVNKLNINAGPSSGWLIFQTKILFLSPVLTAKKYNSSNHPKMVAENDKCELHCLVNCKILSSWEAYRWELTM